MVPYDSVPAPRKDPAAAPRLTSADTFGLTVLVVVVLGLAALAYLAIAPRLEQAAVRLDEMPGGRVEYVQDHAGSLTLLDVANGAPAQRFQLLSEMAGDRTLRRVPGRRTNWLRLAIPNEEAQAREAVLQFTSRDIALAEIYRAPTETNAKAAEPVARTGLKVPMAERSIRSHLPAFRITLPPQHTSVLYVKNQSDLDAPSGVTLWRSLDDFRRYEWRELLPLAAYLALCTAVLFLGAVAAVIFRDRALSLFGVYVAAALVLALFATNIGNWLLPGLAGVPRMALILALVGAVGCVRLLIARALFDSARLSPGVDAFLRFLMWVLAAAVFAGPVLLLMPEALPLTTRIVVVAGVAACAMLPLCACFAAVNGSRTAPLAGVAFGALAIGIAWVVLAHFEMLPPERTGGAPIALGWAVEFLLLGAAVLLRQRVLREEREHAQATHVSRAERAAADAKGDLLSLAHQLAHSKQDKDRLLAMIAQEVRAPLASLVAVTRSLPPDRSAEQLPIIRRRCTALIELLNNLIDWGRLRTGQFPYDPGVVQLALLADTALRPLDSSAVDKGVRLERRIPAGIAVRADPDAVNCVLRNLVGNALKFTATGGTVIVEARPVANTIELRVQDNGVGMTPEQLGRVGPGALAAQLPSTPGTAGETGIGLGLAVTRELLERDGGSLRFESMLGRGTTAIAVLPAEANAAPAPAAIPAPRSAAAILS